MEQNGIQLSVYSRTLDDVEHLIRNLEAVFGQGIHEHLDQVTSILNEETKRHALEEGKPIPDADYILGENLGMCARFLACIFCFSCEQF